MIKASIGKLQIDFDPVSNAEESGFSLLGFDPEAALLLRDMPFHHKDPFDRMMIAQSISLNYPIMTEDPKFALYDCRLLQGSRKNYFTELTLRFGSDLAVAIE